MAGMPPRFLDAADPDLLARGCGAADNLAPGHHAAARRRRSRQLQSGIYRCSDRRDRAICAVCRCGGAGITGNGGRDLEMRWRWSSARSCNDDASVMPLPEGVSELSLSDDRRPACPARPAWTSRCTFRQAPRSFWRVSCHGTTALEGPFATTRILQCQGPYPVFRLHASGAGRRHFLTTFTVGLPRPSVMAEALLEIFKPLLRRQMPEVVDLCCRRRPAPTGCGGSIAKKYPAGTAGDDGPLVIAAAIHDDQAGDRGRRRHRHPALDGLMWAVARGWIHPRI